MGSWCWSYSLHTVTSALDRYWQEQALEQRNISVFMCFFVNNQYRIHPNYGTEMLRHIFESRLRGTPNLLCLFDSYADSCWSKRVWCVFEAYIATQNQIPLTVLLPEK